MARTGCSDLELSTFMTAPSFAYSLATCVLTVRGETNSISRCVMRRDHPPTSSWWGVCCGDGRANT
jgi:hypothetical protein